MSLDAHYGIGGMEAELWEQIPLGMPSRRLDDRIRELCAKVVAATEEEVEPAISELQAALREHTSRLRKLAVTKLTGVLSSRNNRSTV